MLAGFTVLGDNSDVSVFLDVNLFTVRSNYNNLRLLRSGLAGVGGVGAFFVISAVALDIAVRDDAEGVDNTCKKGLDSNSK